MKKAIVLSSLFLALLISALVFSQSSPETNSRIRDKTATTQANVSVMGATQPVANTGLNTASGCYYYGGGVTWDRWAGEAWDADMAVVTNPNVNAFNAFRDATSSKNMWWTGALWSADMAVTAAPNINALTTWRDTTNSKNTQWIGETWDADMGVTTNPNVNAFNVFRDATGSKNLQWSGELWSADMAAPTAAPNVNSLGVYRDVTNSKNIWWTGETWDTSMDIVVAPSVNSNTSFYNATASKGYYWNGITLADNMPAAPVAPYVISLGGFFNSTNNQRWTGLAAGADATTNSTPAPWVANLNYGFNGTTWDRLRTITTQADAQAAGTRGLVTSSFLYGYNGTTFDMLRVDASNNLLVNDATTRPGEDAANDWKKIKKQQTETFTPAATTGTSVVGGAGLTVVLAAIEVLSDVNWCVYIKNTSGSANAFTDAEISTSPNNSDWVSLSFTDCDSLADGSTCVYCVSNNSFRYVRARVACAVTLTVSAWYVSNKG